MTSVRAAFRVVLLAAGLAAGACGGGGGKGGGPAPVVEPAGYLGPTLALDSPARGAMLVGEAGPVTVRGQACDGVHALTAVTVGGVAVPVPAPGAPGCVPFEVQVEARPGLDVVRGEAVNDAGQRGTLAQAFLLAPGYFDAAGAGAGAAAGLLVQLGPTFLDDGDRASLNDVASVVEAVVRSQDLDAMVGEVRFASPDGNGDGRIDEVSHDCVFWTERNRRTGFEAWKSGPVTHGGVHVDALALEDGGLVARLSVRKVRVPFGVVGNLDSGCLGDAQKTVYGDVAVDTIAVEVHAMVGLDDTGAPRVAATSTTASLSGLDIDIALGVLVDWTGLGSLIGDTIEAQVRGRIQAAIRDGVRDAVNAELSRAVAALADFGGRVRLPAVLGGGALAIDSGLEVVDFTAERAVLGARVAVRAEEPRPAHAGGPGALRLSGAPPDSAAMAGHAVAIGIADDVLNQVLHAAWQAGAFDVANLALVVPLDALAPGAHLALASTLPPVVTPREGGGLDLGWGDVAFDLALWSEHGAARITGYLSVSVGLEALAPDPAGTAIVPVLAPDARVAVQVTSVDWDRLPTSRALTEGLVAALVQNALPGVLGQGLSALPLPALDLGALGPGLPSLALEDVRAARLGGYLVVSGGVAARPP